jgi:uncharacterized protein (TIGR00297 family)
VAVTNLNWQSKVILLVVLPAAAVDVVLAGEAWASQAPPVAIWTLGLSALLGMVAFLMHAATPGAAVSGALLTASLMFSSASLPFSPLHTALVPVLVVLVLTSVATGLGRRRKEQLGTAEHRRGRRPSQVAANLGAAALVSCGVAQSWQWNQGWLLWLNFAPNAVFVAGLAALSEAAADTVSSELGQLLSGRPRMITSWCVADPGTDGAISPSGSVAGMAAAALVALLGTVALRGRPAMFLLSWGGGVFGLVFDSLLGATLERKGWLNNDAVNFLSTLGAIAFALALLGILSHAGNGR